MAIFWGTFMGHKAFKLLSRLVVCGMILGCTEVQSPVAPLSISPARLAIVPPSVQGLNLPVGDTTNPAITVNLPAFIYPVIVQLRLEGMIQTFSRSDTYLHPYTGWLDGSGIYTESVFSQCNAHVTFRFSVRGTMGPAPCLYDPAPKSSWVDTSLVEGTGSITRASGIPQFTSDCNYSMCHTYFGTQTAYVTPLPAILQLAASATQVNAGQLVMFTASANPSSIKGLTVPVKVFSWRWVPSGGGTGQTIACSVTSNPCSAIIRESGAMELTALANGAEQVVNAGVIVNGSQVKILPEKSSMIFTAILERPYRPRHDTSTQMITVSVVDANGALIPYQSVTLVQAATENTAGHHHIGGKPVGLLDLAVSVTVNTGTSGTKPVQFRAPEVSGPVTITGTSPGATSGNATINVGLFTLRELFPGTGYALIGGETHQGVHSENHYATQSHIADLQALAARYYAKFASGLQYNDSSLPLGGLFDYAWDEGTPWGTPHGGHRDGVNTDLRIIAVGGVPALTEAQQSQVTRVWARLGGEIFPEGNPKHWHLRYPKN